MGKLLCILQSTGPSAINMQAGVTPLCPPSLRKGVSFLLVFKYLTECFCYGSKAKSALAPPCAHASSPGVSSNAWRKRGREANNPKACMQGMRVNEAAF